MDRLPRATRVFALVTATDWPAVALVVAVSVVAALQVGKAAIALPQLQADLGLTLAEGGWVMAVFALIGVAGGIPVGALTGRFGDRALILNGLFALALGSLAGAFAGGLWPLVLSRIVEGFGFLLIAVPAPVLLGRVAAPQDRDLAFGIWSTFMAAGIAIALIAGPAFSSWQNLWLANGALALAAAVVFAIVIRPGPVSAEPLSFARTARDTGATIAAGGPGLLALAFAAYNLQYFAAVGFLPILLTERLGVSISAAGGLSALAIGANVIGNLLSGPLIARGVPRWVLVAAASGVMGLTGLFIFLETTPPLLVFLLFVIFSAVGGLLPPTVLGGAPALAPLPTLAPISVGLVIQGNNLGQVLGPVLVGGVVASFGWSAAAVPVALAGVMGVGIGWALRGRGK
ncbi:CynX/NimT family MFS transporter [Phreatobacter stygius]|uniref:MFS transporter n=1 Tax=Phreatobacter stygius TaxID=1940610 RepID=A0A4D7BHD7_9HYPH|nr:MFS transporter [Phreatobacter stygius]QCI67217.1 MFS transporter [Phreatobacter stygius]